MKKRILKLTLSAMFLAIAIIVPRIFHIFPGSGGIFLPMHLPVLLCGFICGPIWGAIVGVIAPLFRSLTLGAPIIFPNAVCMAFELMTYGAVAGIMHKLLPRKKPYIYCSLLSSMIIGRLVWGISMFVCLGASGGKFTFAAFLAGAFTNAILGIIIQIILVPLLVMLIGSIKTLNLRE